MHTETDEDTGITVTSTVYSSPLLDNKEFYVTDRDRGFWNTRNDALIVDGEVIVPPTSVAKKSLPLTETEIQTILAAQQGMLPEAPQYEPAADTAIGKGNDFPGALATDAADNLSADLTRSQIQASVAGDVIADMRPPVGFPSEYRSAGSRPFVRANSAVCRTAADPSSAVRKSRTVSRYRTGSARSRSAKASRRNR